MASACQPVFMPPIMVNKDLAGDPERNFQYVDGGVREYAGVNMAIDNASRLLAMQIEDTIYFFDFDKFIITKSVKINGKRTAMVFSQDGTELYTGGTNGEAYDTYMLEKIGLNTGKTTLLQKIDIVTQATHEVTKLSISPDGKELLLYDQLLGGWLMDLQPTRLKNISTTSCSFIHLLFYPMEM